MALKFELTKETLDDTLYAHKDEIEDYIEVEIDDDGYKKILKKAIQFSDELDDQWTNWHKLKCTDEYDDLLDSWDRFVRLVVETAADDVYRK